jgi:hypothetical protein
MKALSIALTAGIALAGTQEKPVDIVPRRGDPVIVRGCISAGTIASSDTEVRDSTGKYSHYVTYRISGNKKIVNPVKKEHDGHLDVLIGVLKSDLPETNAPRGKRLGNTRITIGVGPQPRTDPQRPEAMPVLDVQQIEHTGATCRT